MNSDLQSEVDEILSALEKKLEAAWKDESIYQTFCGDLKINPDKVFVGRKAGEHALRRLKHFLDAKEARDGK